MIRVSQWTAVSVLMSALLLFAPGAAFAQNNDQRVADLEKKVADLTRLVTDLQAQLARSGSDGEPSEQMQIILEEIDSLKKSDGKGGDHWSNKFTLGGYGEWHVNRVDGPDADQSDLHRAVLYMSYDFNEWLSIQSELELEHAFVEGGDGELKFEQLYADIRLQEFLDSNILNFRIGRVLAPLGILNQRHEPPTFNGVERPTFSSAILPSTWSLEGVGIYGDLLDNLKYELYLTNGLDSTGFSATSGIRGGRLHERPGLKTLSGSGRVDWLPFLNTSFEEGKALRLGGSFFAGNAENADEGKGTNRMGNPAVRILALDGEYSISRFDFRGEFANIHIDDAFEIGNNVAEVIQGWYVEAGVHIWPESWNNGIFKESDLVVFTRYEDIDTQHDMPSGVVENEAGDRSEVTVGLTFFLTPHFVIKTDYQWKEDERPGDQARNTLNFGIGWEF